MLRAAKTRYSVVDRLLEQLPRERMLGVVLNRAEIGPDETAYYYQPRHQRVMAAPVDEMEDDHWAANPEMIYLEEDLVS